jgi:hypothetical protein
MPTRADSSGGGAFLRGRGYGCPFLFLTPFGGAHIPNTDDRESTQSERGQEHDQRSEAIEVAELGCCATTVAGAQWIANGADPQNARHRRAYHEPHSGRCREPTAESTGDPIGSDEKEHSADDRGGSWYHL